MTGADTKGRVVRLTAAQRRELAYCAGQHGRSKRAELEAILADALRREAAKCRRRADAK